MKYLHFQVKKIDHYVAYSQSAYHYLAFTKTSLEKYLKTLPKSIELKKGQAQDIHDLIFALENYYQKKAFHFDLALKIEGTKFQKEVWKQSLKIPYGESISYQELAIQMGSAKKTRAVANALAKNPLLILIPCHRVIGSDGQLKGYRDGLVYKEKLLKIENPSF